MNGARSSDPPANDRGTRPATPVSPDISASQNEDSRSFEAPIPPEIEAPEEGDGPRAPSPEPLEEDGSAEAEIEREFGGRLMGLRRLPRSQRGGALRAALEWRRDALAALREKRTRERQSRYAASKLQRPAPG